MKSENNGVSQAGAEQEAKVEDLPVDAKQQDEVKGGVSGSRPVYTVTFGGS
jgi:hypothetical protein